MATIKGITIEFTGNTSKLHKAINNIRKESKSLDKELKAIDSSLKFNPTSVELWKQKQVTLKETIKATEKNLDELKAAQKEMKDNNIDETSADYRELEREILKTENQLKGFKNELRSIPSANVRALGEQFKETGKKMKQAGSYMTHHFTAPIAAGYTAAAKYASDYEENMNKIDVAFGSNAESVKEWANSARDSFGLSKVQASEAVASFGALGKGIGLSEKEAADMSTSLTGLSADLGSYFNTSTEESAKALEGIFTGESEALKKFGVVMNDTNLKQFAEDQGLVWDEMSQSEKVALRYQYVMEKTKDAQGDFDRTSDGTANSIKMFKAAVEDLATGIGTVLLPIITPIIQKITEIVTKFQELSPETQKIITIIGLVVAAIGPLLLIIGTIMTSIGSILTVGPMIIGAISGVVGAIGGIMAAAGPVILVIGSLVAAGVMLYKNWDAVKAWAVSTWGSIKSTISNTVTSIKATVVSVFSAVKATVSSIWNGIKTAILTPIQNAYDTLSGIVKKIKGLFPLSVGKIFSNLKVPSINVSAGSPPFGIGGKGKKPHISVSWHAQGGIFDRPTLLTDRNGGFHGVGEAGAEAIMPLDPLWDKLDNIAAAAQGSGAITINVYGSAGQDARDIADEVRRVLIQEVKQRRLAWQ